MGAGGREFESRCPDQTIRLSKRCARVADGGNRAIVRRVFPSLALALALVAATHPWLADDAARDTIGTRFAPPAGFQRLKLASGSFGAYLRALPILPGRGTVLLFDGRPKHNQLAQAAVIDIDVGKRDLQQCADAVMRFYAEYLRASGREGEVCFRATSGDELPWSRYRAGERPEASKNRIEWRTSRARADASYSGFRRYLDAVFQWAGTASLARGLGKVDAREPVSAGDVFLQGGAPGHAVLVVDVAANDQGERVFLLAQSYMPAQQPHVLRNPGAESPWYVLPRAGPLVTPEWTFDRGARYRFDGASCP